MNLIKTQPTINHFFILLLLVLFLFGVGYYVTKEDYNTYINESYQVNAIVTNIRYNSRLVNQMTGERIKN